MRQERREVGVVERRLRVVLRVVQVGAGVEGDRRVVGERRVRVEQVALVLLDLARRVEDVARPAAVVDGHAVGDVRAADLGPLLELDDDRGVALRVGFEPVIRTSRRFDESGSLSSTRMPWSRRSASWRTFAIARERVAPGRDLGRRRPVAELVEEAVGELVREACLDRVAR